MIIVIRDISDKKVAHDKILEYQEKLRRLNSNLTLAEEKERKAIAAALHDGLGQLLAITSLQLNALLVTEMDPAIIKKIEGTHSSIQRAIQETKSLTYNLSPPILYELGLISTIKWRLEQITEIHGIKTYYAGEEKQLHLSNDMNILLYRTVSELLNNTLKHADATRIHIGIAVQGKHLHITVSDNGKGFDTKQGIRFTAQHGFGLFSINERLNFVGGSLDITSGKEEGTKARIIVPMYHKEEKQNED
ncbi:MAG: sensor histidine kinase [Bacteroidales bacterium]|nr:sensor histidine kinase [Bacteroidales bacterium]